MGRQVCVKCGTPLSQEDNYAPKQNTDGSIGINAEKPTVVFEGGVAGSMNHQLRETVIQGSDRIPNGNPSPALRPTIVQDASKSCPRCHYLMTGKFCANCGYEVSDMTSVSTSKEDDISHELQEKLKNRQNKCVKCNAKVPADFKFCPYCAAPIPQATINIFEEPNANPIAEEELESSHRFSLTPLAGNGKSQLEALIYELVDGAFILNRNNTSPGNRTITSKEQAEVCFVDGQWTLENRSEYNSTFVAALRPIGLKSGDIVLIGNQRFRFDVVEDGEK